MSAAHDQSACQRFDRWLSAYVDAELDAVHCLEVEDHLEGCEGCREHVAHLERTRESLKRMVKVSAPSSLRARLGKSLAEELARPESDVEDEPLSSREPQTGSVRPVAPPPPPGGLSQLRFIVPLAAAALLPICLPAYMVFYAWWQSWPPTSPVFRWAVEHELVPTLRHVTLLASLVCWSWPIVAWSVAAGTRAGAAE